MISSASTLPFCSQCRWPAWFLVVHDRTKAALAAGRVYIVFAVLGEAALLTGLMIGADASEDLQIATVRAAFAEAPPWAGGDLDC